MNEEKRERLTLEGERKAPRDVDLKPQSLGRYHYIEEEWGETRPTTPTIEKTSNEKESVANARTDHQGLEHPEWMDRKEEDHPLAEANDHPLGKDATRVKKEKVHHRKATVEDGQDQHGQRCGHCDQHANHGQNGPTREKDRSNGQDQSRTTHDGEQEATKRDQ